MEALLSAEEYEGWIEFWELEGFGDGRADLRAGIIAATVANCHRGRSARAFTAQDFMPQHKSKKAKTAAEEIQDLDLFFRLHNEAVKRAGG